MHHPSINGGRAPGLMMLGCAARRALEARRKLEQEAAARQQRQALVSKLQLLADLHYARHLCTRCGPKPPSCLALPPLRAPGSIRSLRQHPHNANDLTPIRDCELYSTWYSHLQ
jgi:hypothetical protein